MVNDEVRHIQSVNPPENPVCSVCIANYNGISWLRECLDSILSQDAGISTEIIVHDDASTDDSVAFLREHYPGIELLVSTTNVGFCIGNNRMVEKARGSYVLLLNNDAALCQGALLALLEEQNASDRPCILTLPQYDWTTGQLVDCGLRMDPFHNPLPNMKAPSDAIAYVPGSCLWIERELWHRLGGFPEWMQSIAEDMYLCRLARLRGCVIAVAGKSGYRHRQGSSFGGSRVDGNRLHTTHKRRALSERNKTEVLFICTPTWLMWPLLAVHLSALAFEGAVLTLFRRDREIWKQIYGPVFVYLSRRRKELSARRRKVQSLRSAGLRTYLRGFVFFPHKIAMLFKYGVPEFS